MSAPGISALCLSIAAALFLFSFPASAPAVNVQGVVIDVETGRSIAARLYIQSGDGRFHLAEALPDSPSAAVPYVKQRSPQAVEIHTAVPARGFRADLPSGSYTITVERGKEYYPARIPFTVEKGPVLVRVPLQRWSNMNQLGWYSGDTHVHRTVDELRTLLTAEDLNVGLPLTAWVTDSTHSPARHNKNPDPVPPPELIKLDETHVIWPVNTEYEIFSVNGQRHPLGAVFVLNHRSPLDLTAPPVSPIADAARREGALLDLDKHNWPWSIMLLPVMNVGLFELTNNHLWRTNFLFSDWYPQYAPDFMRIEKNPAGGFTEWGWMDFGFKTYYALLNCGFDLKPSAGTASGVHPVPLGFGRVYVRVDGPFQYEKWIDGLRRGHSFVTTGPMLLADFNGAPPGYRFAFEGKGLAQLTVSGSVTAIHPIKAIQIVVNGDVRDQVAGKNLIFRTSVEGENGQGSIGVHRRNFTLDVAVPETSWIAVRAFTQLPDGRLRFAHTAPVYIDMNGRPPRPKRPEVEYFIARIDAELARHQGVLPESALHEFAAARAHFSRLLKHAK